MKTKRNLIQICLLSAVLLPGGVNAQTSFTPATNYPVGHLPWSVAAADVNGDGKVDLICANRNDNSLMVLTNIGNGVFGSNATYNISTYGNIGSDPYSVVAADVNGDGWVDLICANNGDNTLMVLTNNGNGIFGHQATYFRNSAPLSVTAADINGDGKVDLVVLNNTIPSISVLTNNGAGYFVLSAEYPVGNTPQNVVAADINSDGKLDLICANYGDKTLLILTNSGGGIFGSNATLSIGSGPSWVAAADINGDGKVDLIAANGFSANTLIVWTNNGGGLFGSNATYTVGNSPLSVAAADINGDGKVDLVCANEGDKTLSVLTNNGSGHFVNASLPGVDIGPNSVITADVNGDGRLDLACVNLFGNTLSVVMNTSIFPPPNSTPTLAINHTKNAMLVSWPSVSAGWSLQQSSDLKATNWSPSGYSGYATSDDGTNKSLIISPPAGNMFFRMLHP